MMRTESSVRLWIAVTLSLAVHVALLGLLRDGAPSHQRPEIRFTLVPRPTPAEVGVASKVPQAPAETVVEAPDPAAEQLAERDPRPAQSGVSALAQTRQASSEKPLASAGPITAAAPSQPDELPSEPVSPVAAAPAPPPPSPASGFRLLIKDQLKKHQRYPPAARRRGVEGAAVVRFVIARDGSLVNKQLVESSGSRHLDAAALRLLSRAAPYPALPEDLATDLLEIQLPIEYRITAGRHRT